MVNSKSWCGCPGGNPGICPTCTATNPIGTDIICSSGNHNSKYCFLDWLGSSGTMCVKTGLSYSNRYRVIKFKPTAVKDFGITVSFSTGNATAQSWFGEYSGNVVSYEHQESQFNLTILSDTVQESYKPIYVVYDNHATSDFYLLDETDVNGLDQFVSRKIGWLKSDKNVKLSPSLGKEFDLKLRDCFKNQIDVIYPWVSTKDMLSQRKSKLSRAVSPGALLIDPDFKQVPSEQNAIPDHAVSPYAYLKQGWILVNSGGTIGFVGIGLDDQYIPRAVSSLTINQNVTTNKGLFFVGACLYADTGVYDAVENIYYTLRFISISNQTYGFCLLDLSTYITCSNVSFHGISWPENKEALFYFDGSFKKTFTSTVASPSQIILNTEPANGVVTGIVTFSNLKITFEDLSTRAAINSLTADEEKVTMIALALTSSGDCNVYSTPSWVIQTQKISLTLNPTTYELFYTAGKFGGKLIIGINCFKGNVEKNC
jgi:hypothetical protein